MSISGFERLMRDCGLDEPLVTRWREAAAQLPALAEPPVIEGLNRTQATVLLSRLLRRVAAIAGIDFAHPDLIAHAGFRLTGPFPQTRADGRPQRRSVARSQDRRAGDIWDGPAARMAEPADRRRSAHAKATVPPCSLGRGVDGVDGVDGDDGASSRDRIASRRGAVLVEKNH